jgi:uncharacterized protein (TIGR02271 family)
MHATVTDLNNEHGSFSRDDLANARVMVTLDDGSKLMIPVDLLTETEDGRFTVPIRFAQIDEGGAIVVPVIEEQASVTKEAVETGKVRVTKTVREEEQTIYESLLREDVNIDRVPINEMVEESSGIRQEGDTTIVPLYEEVLVVEKRLMLKEELRITKHRNEQETEETVTLRHEQVHTDRTD